MIGEEVGVRGRWLRIAKADPEETAPFQGGKSQVEMPVVEGLKGTVDTAVRNHVLKVARRVG